MSANTAPTKKTSSQMSANTAPTKKTSSADDRASAAKSFFDGIPGSVSAQIAQLLSMHAIARLSTSNDHTRNGVVSSLATTVIGLVVAAAGSVVRHGALWALSPPPPPPREGGDALLEDFRAALAETNLVDIKKLNYSLGILSSNQSDGAQSFGANVCDVLCFQFTIHTLTSNVQIIYNASDASLLVASVEAANYYAATTVAKAAMTAVTDDRPMAQRNRLLTLRPAVHDNTVYGVVVLTLEQVMYALHEERSTQPPAPPLSAAEAKKNAEQVLYDYLLQPVFLFQTRLYSASMDSLHLVTLCVYLAYHRSLRDKTIRRLNYQLNHIVDLETRAAEVPAGSVSSGNVRKIVYEASEPVDLGAQYRLDAMFLESKAVLVNALDKFQRKEMYPRGLAVTNKLSCLLFGPPGTGKTNTIRAMCNHLGRSLIRIDCSKFVEFDEDEFCRTIRKYTKTHVIELDEFDHVLAAMEAQAAALEAQERIEREFRARCMFGGAARSYDSEDDETEDEEEEEVVGKKDDGKKAAKKAGHAKGRLLDRLNRANTRHGPRPITANFLLRWLDGLGQDEDRVIVLCTNNPQLIRTDFYRPGRIDIKLYCGFCTAEMMADLANTKFPRSGEGKDCWQVEEVESQFAELVARNITPLHFINALSEADDLGTLMELLKEMPQVPDYPYQRIFESDAQRAAKIRAAAGRLPTLQKDEDGSEGSTTEEGSTPPMSSSSSTASFSPPPPIAKRKRRNGDTSAAAKRARCV